MTGHLEKEIKIVKSTFKNPRNFFFLNALKFKYFCVVKTDCIFFFSFLSWFLWNMMNGCHCILEPLGVKKTQETCSVVTKSLILRPWMTLFLALGARFRSPKVGRSFSCSFFSGEITICPLIFAVWFLWSKFQFLFVSNDMKNGSSQLQGVKMSEALVIHIKLN